MEAEEEDLGNSCLGPRGPRRVTCPAPLAHQSGDLLLWKLLFRACQAAKRARGGPVVHHSTRGSASAAGAGVARA